MARTVEVASKATFGVVDKRAQYARLAVFNYGVQEKMISKDKDVNSVSNSDLEKAGKALAGGNLLGGKEGIELIQKLTKAGASHANVAKNGLTVAYAQEVRPFIRRLQFSDEFGRIKRPLEAKPKGAKAKSPAAKKASTPKESGAKEAAAATS